MNSRLRLALAALLTAALACGVNVGGSGQDIPATVNAISTAVQLTLDAQTAAPSVGSATPTVQLPPTSIPLPTTPPAPAASATPLVVVTLPADIARPNGPLLHAARRAAPPQIDGNLSEWGALPNSISEIVFRPENWSGPADQSVAYALAWDAANLYLAAHVTDDVHAQTQLGDQIYKGDSLEILLDAELRGDYADANLSADDYQLGLTPGEQKIGGPDAYLWFPARRAGRPEAAVSARQDETGNGYYLEAAIPWSAFGLAPQGGERFGFALSSSDNDTPGTAEQQSMISTAPTRKLTDPTTWGTLVLDN
jgi:hypothetical protein